MRDSGMNIQTPAPAHAMRWSLYMWEAVELHLVTPSENEN